MKKIIYSLTKISKRKENTKVKGVGYVNGNDLIIALKAQNGNPYIKVFEDALKNIHKVPGSENEYSGMFYDFIKIDVEVKPNSFEEKEIAINYYLWYVIKE